LAAIPPLIAIPFQWKPNLEYERKPVDYRPNSVILGELVTVFTQWKMIGPAIFIFVYSMTPGMGSSSFYYYTNELKIDKEWMAILGIMETFRSLIQILIIFNTDSDTDTDSDTRHSR